MEIFKLFGSIFIDTDDAEKSIGKTDDKAKGLADTLGSGVKKAGKWAAGIATAAVSAGAALGEAVNQTAEYADEIDKASFRSGIGAENLQRFKYAAEQSGATLEDIEKSAKKVNERLGEVAEGNEKSIEMFEKLGVSVYDAEGEMRSSDDVYNDVISKLADMGDTAEATAIGTDLFGKAFVELKPMLAAGSDGIQDLKDNADALGIVMSQDAVSAGVVYGDTIADIKNSLGGMVRSLGASVLPMFQKFADKLIDWMPKIQSVFSGFEGEFEKTAEILLDTLFTLLENLLPPLMELVVELMPLVSEVVEIVLPLLVEALQFVGDVIAKTVIPAFEGLMAFLDGDWALGIQKAAEAYTGAFESAFAFIDGLFGTNLSKWYSEVTAFWRDAGAKLYEATHAGEINETELLNKYGSLDDDIIQISNEYIRRGVDSAEALQKAMDEVLDTSEKVYYFNQNFKDVVTEEDAARRAEIIKSTGQLYSAPSSAMADYYASLGKAALEKTPALADGGLVYGKTLAFVGDNADAAINPEVVAPLSELKSISKNDTNTLLLSEIKELISQLVVMIGTPQKVEIPVKLSNGTKLASAIVDDINALIRNKGKTVFVQV